MGLVLKHIERTKSGSWQYRRRVPKDVAEVIAKREFKRKLGDSQRAALAAYPRYHAEVEREIAEAKLGRARTKGVANAKLSEREAYAEALRRRADLVAAGASQDDLDIVADTLADKYPQDEDGPLGVPPLDRYTINLLRDAPGKIKAPEPTLGDALKLYLKEHLNESHPDTDSRVVGLARRVIETAINAMGRDPALSSIAREDARAVRDEMLDRVKVRGRGVGGKVSAATVSRELTIITAVINFAKVEFGLGDNVQNPFSRLPVERVAKGQGRKASEKRDPLPVDVLKETRDRILANASPALAHIWRLIEGTGCRIAEITGLRVEDVKVTGDLPHIRIEPHDLRSLKTESSRRQVPLVGDALAAAQEALEAAEGELMLFPTYGRNRGSDAASASLMKHLRRVSVDEKHVIHSLRHNMKDRLTLSEAASLDQNLILGHALGGVGDRVYGGEVAKLRATTRVMKRAFGLEA
ncbi:MAG: tyrosine-type recombinase/integrase [Pseudotabrizicola sp.]|uniref:tyrosine-type recombinase/integrase n=1 Tax=Pseudotabrizicola sp. TaxID=2939647 RepID=UPI0027231E21|nr:tyrosine-type recombinase/integrase [Pseudotabrizicola sp.]MDO9639816.1 tyrosine-type recombinase/integrase [Pseudotabrizicola sp.]